MVLNRDIPLWVGIAVILVTICGVLLAGLEEYEQHHAVQRDSHALPQTASHRERSHITRLFLPHKIQFVIQAEYTMERFLRRSFSPFPEYHKRDTIIRTFKPCSGQDASGSARVPGLRKPNRASLMGLIWHYTKTRKPN